MFSTLQPYWDIYSFSKTGLALLEIISNESTRSWIKPLKKELTEVVESETNVSIGNLISRMEFLKPIHREVASIPELSMGIGSGVRKMMPVEALTTSKRLHRLISHPGLLRLSHVPQLTTANQILPGANHTRYEHTLGVIETMRKYLLSLLDESDFLEHLSTKKIELALLSAALSSATRFPISNVIHEIRNRDKSLYKEFTKKKIHLKLLNFEDRNGVALKNLIREEFSNIEVKELVRILCNEVEDFDDADHLIYSLLNCSIDVRVIDFVRRDSHHLGTFSGDSFEIDEILPHVTINEHKLALRVQGVSTAEQIILLRYWLFSRVYWNKPNRSFFSMVQYLLLELYKESGFINEFLEKSLSFSQESIVTFLAKQCEDRGLENLKDLAERISSKEHLLYITIFETSRIENDLKDSFNKLERCSLSDLESLRIKIATELEREFSLSFTEEVVPVLIDYPIEPGNIKMGQDITILGASGVPQPLLKISGITAGVNSSFRDQLSKFRVFMHPSIAPAKQDRKAVRKKIVEVVNSFLEFFEP